MPQAQQLSLRCVMIVGDVASDAQQLRHDLGNLSANVIATPAGEAAWELAQQVSPDLVLLADRPNRSDTMCLLDKLRASRGDSAVVVVSDNPSLDWAVRFVRAGACDYIRGPLDADSLHRLLEGLNAEAASAGKSQQRFFSGECPPGVTIAGRSRGIIKTLETIRLVAQSRCNPILLLGETGTGKELAAQAVHAWRCGTNDNFVAINCAALTANLLESELFGHVKGAFTGADRDKTGLFELAGDGSIFLDEISEMPVELQAKLLRVLQERTFRKVGGAKTIACNATVIASSNRDLQQEVRCGRFRRDLYYRLAVFPISTPPLRHESRRDDILLLADFFIQTCGGGEVQGLTKPAQQALLRHDWPGNVRELRNVIERALILSRGPQITPESLIIEPLCEPAEPAADNGTSAAAQQTPCDTPRRHREFSLEAAEREFILRALRETGWQRTRAAALLGITRATLHAKLKRYEINPPGGELAGDEASGSESDIQQAGV